VHLIFGVSSIQITFALHITAYSIEEFLGLPVAVDELVMQVILGCVKGLLLPPLQLGLGILRLPGQDGHHRRMTVWPQSHPAQSLLLVDVGVVHVVHPKHLRWLLGLPGMTVPHSQRMEGIIPIDLAIAGTLHQADDLEHGHARTGIIAHKNWGKKKIFQLFIPDFWEIKVSLTYIKTASKGENYKIAQVYLLLQHDHQNNV